MYKKVIYSSISLPFWYVTGSAWLWQKRRKIEKIDEIAKRTETLSKPVEDITPKNGGKYDFNYVGKFYIKKFTYYLQFKSVFSSLLIVVMQFTIIKILLE